MFGPTPHLLGRPLLFEITEMDQPEPGVASRWVARFHVANVPDSVFELRDETETMPSNTFGKARCYQLYENGIACGAGRWHFGPETARNAVVAMVENHARRALLHRDAREQTERSGATQNASVGFLNSLSSQGLKVLDLFSVSQVPAGGS